MPRRWTESEDSFVRDNYDRLSPGDIAVHLNRTKDLVVWRAGVLGLRKSRNPPWSDAENEFLRANYPKMSIRDISARLGRSYTAIQHQADRNGIVKSGNPGGTWTVDDDDLLRDLHGVMEMTEVATYLARTPGAVKHRASQLGLNKRTRRGPTTTHRVDTVLTMRRDAVRHDYFAEIDTPLKAYVLGWLASDGNVKRNGNTIRLRLNSKDEEILWLVRQELAPLNPVSRYQSRRPSGEMSTMSRFEVGSERMKQDLARLGVTPNKALTLQYPDIGSEFNAAFILGYFDGDGSLFRTTDQRFHWKITSGSKPFLIAVQQHIHDATGVGARGPHSNGKGSRAHRITVNGSRIPPVDAWLHADVPGLARKRLPGMP